MINLDPFLKKLIVLILLISNTFILSSCTSKANSSESVSQEDRGYGGTGSAGGGVGGGGGPGGGR